MASQTREYDIIVFGASGFTAKFVIEELSRVADEDNIKWAIAGRNMKKLQEVLSVLTTTTGNNYSELPIIIADATSEESLKEMCDKTKAIINCCGPFVHFGEKVIQACIESKTHYVDICGEVIFLEQMQLKYNNAAQENKIYIVGACAFRCLPIDMGLVFTSQKFDGDLNSVECYLSTTGTVKFSYPTFECQVYGFQTRKELKPLRKALFSSDDFKHQHEIKPKSGLFFDKNSSKYCSTWPDAFKSVLYRSQKFIYDNDKCRPTQYALYVCHDSILFIISFLIMGFFMNFLATFSWGRKLLSSCPGFFSGGLAQADGPTKSQIESASFSTKFYGKGYSTRAKELTDTHEDQPDKCIVTRIVGPDPGYLTTAVCVVQAAIVVLKENQKMPNEGGVLSPAAAFRKTSLIERLCKRNVKFEVLEEKKKADPITTTTTTTVPGDKSQ